MKAVVTKIRNNQAIILQSNGAFQSIPNKGYIVGQEIYTKESGGLNMSRFAKVTMVAAIALVFMALGGGLVYGFAVPQSYVSLDINPSIELEINLFNQVIKANGLNDDGTKVLQEISVNNKNIDKALEMIVGQLELDGYLATELNNTIFLAVYSDNDKKANEIMEAAKETVSTILDDAGVSIKVKGSIVNDDILADAREIGATAGKLELAEIYMEVSDDDADIDDLLDMTVEELLEEISENLDEDAVDAITSATADAGAQPDGDTGQSTDDADAVSGASINSDGSYDDDDHDDDDEHDDDDD